jgi:hypothetical protein
MLDARVLAVALPFGVLIRKFSLVFFAIHSAAVM